MSADPKFSPIELRGLAALRRAGSRGMLNAHIMRKMRPCRGTQPLRDALRRLEAMGLIDYRRAAGVQSRVQGNWRLTERGRAVYDVVTADGATREGPHGQ